MTIGQGLARNAATGANLLVALLLRYPAIGSASVDTSGKQLRFTFLVSDRGSDQAALWVRHLEEMLNAYFALERTHPEHCELKYEAHAGLGLIHIKRDLNSIKQGEIALIVEAVEEQLGSDLRSEGPDFSLAQDDLLMQEEWIGYMLENIRTGDEPQSLLAFREGGRVLVYNANKS
ncbi:MAG: hypothetical protein ACM3ZQ_10925 [Bacillota bacterium]